MFRTKYLGLVQSYVRLMWAPELVKFQLAKLSASVTVRQVGANREGAKPTECFRMYPTFAETDACSYGDLWTIPNPNIKKPRTVTKKRKREVVLSEAVKERVRERAAFPLAMQAAEN